MLKKLISFSRQVLIVTLIISLTLPNVVFAATPLLSDEERAWRSLPTIQPLDAGRVHFADEIQEHDMFSAHDNFLSNELAELPPEVLEEMMNAHIQTSQLDDDFYIRDYAALVYPLLNSGLGFSVLSEDDQALILAYLNIDYDARGITIQLFGVMAQDGFSLVESVELVKIMASGLFDYMEAQMILELIPDADERAEELMWFEQFARLFNIADEVNERRLLNRPFTTVNDFSEDVDDGYYELYASMVAFDEPLGLERATAQFWDISSLLNANRSNESYNFFEPPYYSDEELALPDEPPASPELPSELEPENDEAEEENGYDYEGDYEYEDDNDEYPELELEPELYDPELNPEVDSEVDPEINSEPESEHISDNSEQDTAYNYFEPSPGSQPELAARVHTVHFMSYGSSSADTQRIVFDERDFWTFDEVLEDESDADNESEQPPEPELTQPEYRGQYPEDETYPGIDEYYPEQDDQYPETDEYYPELEYEYDECKDEYPEREALYPPLSERPQQRPRRGRDRLRNSRMDSALRQRPWQMFARMPM